MNKHVDVRYPYAESVTHTTSTQSPMDIQDALIPSAFSGLPTELLVILEHV